MRRYLPALSLLLSFAAPPADGQVFLASPGTHDLAGRWLFDVGAQVAQPLGDFATQVDRAWGVGASVRYHLRRASALGVRADVTGLNYGNERKRVPLSPTINRVLVDMNTSNDIAVITAGPELIAPSGPIRPYAFAFAGVSYFFTQSSVGEDDGGRDFAQSTNYSDGGFAAGYGGGVRIPMSLRSVDVAFDAGARLTRNGTRSYLRRGDIIDQPDGSLLFTPRRTSADFWQYHVALSFAPRFH